jgi:ABC-type lipoprotein release transport system permease subunit
MFILSVASFIYGVPTVDPVTFLAVPAFMVAITFIVCVFPAWKAVQIDPVDALRRQ